LHNVVFTHTLFPSDVHYCAMAPARRCGCHKMDGPSFHTRVTAMLDEMPHVAACIVL